ncbi:hypothetical protein LTR08_007404 [Meristemomyces frigidus]|nr:hypothetical protein LTR08_007404 [Meristemomyces frigidus]
MDDFRNLQDYIASIRANPSAKEYYEEGYMVLRRCVVEAQALLLQPFQTQGGARDDEEQNKVHLRRIIQDAAVRRFRAQTLFLRATAALRWVKSRAVVLQGQECHAGHLPALQQVKNTLRAELASITDQRVELSLRAADSAVGKWLQEDPSLGQIQRLISNGNAQSHGP